MTRNSVHVIGNEVTAHKAEKPSSPVAEARSAEPTKTHTGFGKTAAAAAVAGGRIMSTKDNLRFLRLPYFNFRMAPSYDLLVDEDAILWMKDSATASEEGRA